MEALDDRRRKLQKSINLTDAQMKVIRPAHTTTVRSLFDATSNVESELFNKKFQGTAEQQKEIVNYMEINEYLMQFFANHFIDIFKVEKVAQYQSIMRRVAAIETDNSQKQEKMWTRILADHLAADPGTQTQSTE